MESQEKSQNTEPQQSGGEVGAFQKAMEEAVKSSEHTGIGEMTDALETGAEAASPDTKTKNESENPSEDIVNNTGDDWQEPRGDADAATG